MTTYRLEIAYDGAGFSGWARQGEERTVQEELEAALRRLFGESIELTAAGRTDAGVHALAQVASFSSRGTPPETLLRAVNSLTPRAIAVRAIEPAPARFDARRDARSRSYRYRIETPSVPSPFERGRALHHPHRLDRAALEACAELLVGAHEFTAFTPTETEHVRFEREVITARWYPESDRILRFEIEADSFMRRMVRILVGTMLEVGTGQRSVASFGALLGGASRTEAGETAAAHGLYLIAVSY